MKPDDIASSEKPDVQGLGKRGYVWPKRRPKIKLIKKIPRIPHQQPIRGRHGY